ncbi:MAG: hypothetical protein NVS1B11_35390 [Terriglobales bacterium]
MRQTGFRKVALLAIAMSLAVTPGFGQQKSKAATDYKAPLKIPREFFSGIHVAKDDPKFQMEAQHYCSPLKNGMFQCVLFDSTGADAKLMGIEYIISDDMYKTLPDGEKKFWHPHPFEVLGGGLIAPDMTASKEHKFMGTIMNTWGKTFHTWGDSMTDIPLGEPRLMWAVTGPGQVDEKLLQERDKKFKVNTEQISARRQKEFGYELPNVAPPKSLDTVGRRWTNEGPDTPTPIKPQK